MCYNPKKYAHHGLGSEVRIYRKIGNDDSGQLCDAPMKKFCAFQQLGRSVLGRWSQRPPFRSKRYRSPRLRRRPRHTPEKSIQTSMRLEPRPGEKIWMVSSMQAAASPKTRVNLRLPRDQYDGCAEKCHIERRIYPKIIIRSQCLRQQQSG